MHQHCMRNVGYQAQVEYNKYQIMDVPKSNFYQWSRALRQIRTCQCLQHTNRNLTTHFSRKLLYVDEKDDDKNESPKLWIEQHMGQTRKARIETACIG